MQFKAGTIHDIAWTPLTKYHDQRGWLCELFRRDQLAEGLLPAMGYVSVTEPGVARGPHEHVAQADYFCFLGPGDFRLYLWDMRATSPTFGVSQVETVGATRPMAVVVPPGVVHAYRNVSTEPGVVLNFPNQLYKGWGRAEAVDEIRHEGRADSPFHLDESGCS